MPDKDVLDKVRESYEREADRIKRRNQAILIVTSILVCLTLGTVTIYFFSSFIGR